MFTLTEAHLKLLRQGSVLWSPMESGAPAILISPLEIKNEAFAQMLAYGKLAESGPGFGRGPG